MTEDTLVVLYEEWIAHPDRHAFVPIGAHHTLSVTPGWWRTTWAGDEAAVRARGFTPSASAQHD